MPRIPRRKSKSNQGDVDSGQGFRLPTLLKAASPSKSTYYFEIGKPDADAKNREAIKLIQAIFEENKGRYGVRKVTMELNARLRERHKGKAAAVNHKKVQRIMEKLGLKAIAPKVKYRSYMGVVGAVVNNIINRDFTATKPNEKWTTDVSQFNCPFGKAYLSPNFEQTNRMLDEAFSKNPNLEGAIFHSD